MGDLGAGVRRRAPAAARNVAFIEAVLRDWLPASGIVLEVSSGTGEHALAFARAFPGLEWQPTDPDPQALASIESWGEEGTPNLLPVQFLDASSATWPVEKADAVLNINMVHIAPVEAGLGLLDGAARVLDGGSPLILYGPWLEEGITPAPSNIAFDQSLKSRDPSWGLRTVEWFANEADKRGLDLVERRSMPANNLMLRLVKRPA